jgi:hypothetical protein
LRIGSSSSTSSYSSNWSSLSSPCPSAACIVLVHSPYEGKDQWIQYKLVVSKDSTMCSAGGVHGCGQVSFLPTFFPPSSQFGASRVKSLLGCFYKKKPNREPISCERNVREESVRYLTMTGVNTTPTLLAFAVSNQVKVK